MTASPRDATLPADIPGKFRINVLGIMLTLDMVVVCLEFVVTFERFSQLTKQETVQETRKQSRQNRNENV